MMNLVRASSSLKTASSWMTTSGGLVLLLGEFGDFGTLAGDDGQAVAVLELAVPEDVVLRHGDLVDLELVLDPPADVVVRPEALRLVAALRGAL